MGLSRTSLTQQVAAQLVNYVREKGLKPGDSIPTTRSLAAKFGVNSATLREALRQLEATGGILLRHGSGIFVGPNLDRLLLANPTSPAVSMEMAIQLINARLAIEPQIAALAALNYSTDDLAVLSEALPVSRQPVTEGPRNLPSPNFHRALAAASRNVILFEIIDSILTAYRWEQHTIRVVFADRERDHQQHVSIFDAVSDRDPHRSALLTEAHLKDILGATLKAASSTSDTSPALVRD